MSFLFIIEGGDEKCCNMKELDSQAFVPALHSVYTEGLAAKINFEKEFWNRDCLDTFFSPINLSSA